VRLDVAAVRHGHGGHSFETASAREGEAIEDQGSERVRSMAASVDEEEQETNYSWTAISQFDKERERERANASERIFSPKPVRKLHSMK
jgi:hypothetical protein